MWDPWQARLGTGLIPNPHERKTVDVRPVVGASVAVVAGEEAVKPIDAGKSNFSILAEYDSAVAGITQNRGKNYGHPSLNFERIARLQDVCEECKDPLIKQVLRMLCVKIARLIETPEHLDSLIDIAGYARTGAMVLDKRNSP